MFSQTQHILPYAGSNEKQEKNLKNIKSNFLNRRDNLYGF